MELCLFLQPLCQGRSVQSCPSLPLSLSLSLSPPLTLHASAFLQSHNFVPLPPFPPSFLPLFRFLKFQYAWNSPHALLLVLRISLYCTPACEWVSVAGIQRHPPTPFPSSPHCQRVIRVRPGVSPTVLQAPIFPPLGFYLSLDITARKEQNDELAEVSHDPPPLTCAPPTHQLECSLSCLGNIWCSQCFCATAPTCSESSCVNEW